MLSSGMLRRVTLVRTDVSEEVIASKIGVKRISELGTILALTNNVTSSFILFTLMMEAIRSSETSVLTRAAHYFLKLVARGYIAIEALVSKLSQSLN
jgi:hypothetical protein